MNKAEVRRARDEDRETVDRVYVDFETEVQYRMRRDLYTIVEMNSGIKSGVRKGTKHEELRGKAVTTERRPTGECGDRYCHKGTSVEQVWSPVMGPGL